MTSTFIPALASQCRIMDPSPERAGGLSKVHLERRIKPEHMKANLRLLMIYIMHYLKDPKLGELWYIPYYG